MSYIVQEIFYSLQGEGARTGRPAVFCRFAGCNLWSGREVDRATARCNFCDTNFRGDVQCFVNSQDLAETIANFWPKDKGDHPYVICTGGEPLLQLDHRLISDLHDLNFEVAIETNGTILAPPKIDWVCVSPKGGVDLVQTCGDELKLVYPQLNLDPHDLEHLDFRYFFLQPMDGPELARNTAHAIQYCLDHPSWYLSLQIHKYLSIK